MADKVLYHKIRWEVYFNGVDNINTVCSDPLEDEPVTEEEVERIEKLVKTLIGSSTEGNLTFPCEGMTTVIRSSQVRMVRVLKTQV
jgi:hypothetical protein